jgi:ceramide glucosyltransferase
MLIEFLLIVWSIAGLVWWIIALRLVLLAARKGGVTQGPRLPRSLSIFKPLPPLGDEGLQVEAAGLESFISQLDDSAELLLGIHETDRRAAGPFVDRMRRKYPKASVRVIYRSRPDDVANPKIAWQKVLAPEAQGELWLWSDADIVAPPGFLQAARRDYERSGALMVTFPYVVRAIPSSLALLDALFINAEFYPGVLLLRKLGPIDFGLGAAMLFARSDFENRVDCTEIGAALADDFVLGQKLSPVQIGSVTLTTASAAVSGKDAVLHHLRWNKTVRWNRPLGFAGRILALPMLGWLIYLILHPAQPFAWGGFLGLIQLEVLFAVMICRKVGCRLRVRNLLMVELWSLWRVGVWIGCWFPWPVNWRGQLWWGPRWTEREKETTLNMPDVVGETWRKDLPGNL